jgi:hypothetical protein
VITGVGSGLAGLADDLAAQTASRSRSPVRTRSALSTELTQIFPSPMAPVLTALAIASATGAAD